MFRYLRFPESTWGALPPAGGLNGRIYRITDVGVAGAGILVISDGTRWMPLGRQCLGRSAVAASVTGTLSETVLGSVTIPPGLLGLNGGVEISASWSFTNSANSKTVRERLGGLSGTALLSSAQTTQVQVIDVQRVVRNRNSASSQVCSPSSGILTGGTSSGSVLTGAINTAVAQNVVFTGQLANTGEQINLETYSVWALP